MRGKRARPSRVFADFDNDDKRSNDEAVWEITHKEFPRVLNSTKHSLGLGPAAEAVIKKTARQVRKM